VLFGSHCHSLTVEGTSRGGLVVCARQSSNQSDLDDHEAPYLSLLLVFRLSLAIAVFALRFKQRCRIQGAHGAPSPVVGQRFSQRDIIEYWSDMCFSVSMYAVHLRLFFHFKVSVCCRYKCTSAPDLLVYTAWHGFPFYRGSGSLSTSSLQHLHESILASFTILHMPSRAVAAFQRYYSELLSLALD
jgi:hypothetical protein